MSAIYAIVEATSNGWTSTRVLSLGALAVLLMAAFVALEARVANPIMPLRVLRLPGLVNASLVRGFLVTGMYSTFFLGTLYLEQVRHYSALRDRRGLPALDAHRRRPLAGHHGAAGRAVRPASRSHGRHGERGRRACSCSAPSAPDTSFFPTIFLACFAIGLGIGNAFMPLLTIAMADVPAADAGLGSGITNVSQQISGALGLAVLSTLAANHTKGLLADHHGLTSSLIDGYQLAFLIGAGTIAIGIAPRVRAPAAARPATRAPTGRAPCGRCRSHERPPGGNRRMTHTNRSLPVREPVIGTAGRRRASHYSDAVVAAYINENLHAQPVRPDSQNAMVGTPITTVRCVSVLTPNVILPPPLLGMRTSVSANVSSVE